MWDTKDRTLVGEITLLRDAKACFLAHPATYLNKILIGFDDGELLAVSVKHDQSKVAVGHSSIRELGALELWNFRSRTLVYSFTSHSLHLEPDDTASTVNTSAGISVIEQSPALDVVAVGFRNGLIGLLNLKYDKLVGVSQAGLCGDADFAH